MVLPKNRLLFKVLFIDKYKENITHETIVPYSDTIHHSFLEICENKTPLSLTSLDSFSIYFRNVLNEGQECSEGQED